MLAQVRFSWEMRLALEAMGQMPSDQDVKDIMNELDENRNGTLGERQLATCAHSQLVHDRYQRIPESGTEAQEASHG